MDNARGDQFTTSPEHPMGWPNLEVVDVGIHPHPGSRIAPDLADDPVTAEIQLYSTWNKWLYGGGSLIETICAVLTKTITNPEASNAIGASCHSFYDAVQGMNIQIVAAIKGLGKTPPQQPQVTFPPDPLPPWSDDSSPDAFTAGWGVIKSALEQVDAKLVASKPNDPITVALGGLIGSGDNIVNTLKKYYPAWAQSNSGQAAGK